MNIQKCNKCGKEFPLSKEYFHVDKRNPNGFRQICKDCAKAVLYKNKNRKRSNKRFDKPEVNFDVNEYQNVEVIQKFKELYLEKALPFNKIRKVTGLSVGNVHFLLDILGIRLTPKQLTDIRRKNRVKEWNKLRPVKKELEKMYKKYDYHLWTLKKECFFEVPYNIFTNWFKEYKIPHRYITKYKSSEDRLKQIITVLNEKGDING